jgi:porin
MPGAVSTACAVGELPRASTDAARRVLIIMRTGIADPNGRFNRACCLMAGLLLPTAAQAQSGTDARAEITPPAISVDASLVIDAMTTVGHDHHDGVAARASLGATLDGARLGLGGLSANVTFAAYWGPGISSSFGDLQGVSSVAAPRMVRPVNAWLQWDHAPQKGLHLAVKAGIIDTNADFDEQNTGSLFLGASHGMGPELASAGVNGSGPAPYSALGVIGFVSNDAAGIKLRLGLFGGATGDPARPKRITYRFGGDAGHIAIAEIERQKPGWRIALGGWRHTGILPSADGTGSVSGATGLFVLTETQIGGKLPDSTTTDPFRVQGWLRLGQTFTRSTKVESYLGGGFVVRGMWRRLPGDALGLAVARAQVQPGIDPALRTETVIEASWQHHANAHMLIQPDVQWLIHPGADTTRGGRVVLGLRVIVLR